MTRLPRHPREAAQFSKNNGTQENIERLQENSKRWKGRSAKRDCSLLSLSKSFHFFGQFARPLTPHRSLPFFRFPIDGDGGGGGGGGKSSCR